MSLISIIIPTYQRATLLSRAIDSVLKQSFSDFQVLIFDNASTDNTKNVVDDFSKRDRRIRYHRHSKNLGMLGNYRFAFNEIQTKYFCVLSDDDYLFPHFLETALKGFEQEPHAALSACGIDIREADDSLVGNPLNLWPREGVFNPPDALIEMLSFIGKYPVPTGVLYQHEMVKKIEPLLIPEMKLMWDPDYLLQISAQFPIVINKTVCGVFLAHDGGFSCKANRDLLQHAEGLRDYLVSYRMMIDRVSENDHLDHAVRIRATQIFGQMIRNYVGDFMYHYLHYQKYDDAFLAGSVLWKNFGFNKRTFKYFAKACLGRLSPLLLQNVIKLKQFKV